MGRPKLGKKKMCVSFAPEDYEKLRKVARQEQMTMNNVLAEAVRALKLVERKI